MVCQPGSSSASLERSVGPSANPGVKFLFGVRIPYPIWRAGGRTDGRATATTAAAAAATGAPLRDHIDGGHSSP